MRKQNIFRIISLAFVTVLAVVVLGACTAQNTTTGNERVTANQEYMAQVNRTMEDLSDKLEGFTDAVARGDVVTMRTQADNAFKAIDDLSGIEAPEELKEIQAEYEDGCNNLKSALNDYITLYTEIESATEAQPFD